MLSDLTAEEFEAMKAALDFARMLESDARKADPKASLGLATPYGKRPSYAELAEWFDTSAADIRMTEQAALEKLCNNPMAYALFLETF